MSFQAFRKVWHLTIIIVIKYSRKKKRSKKLPEPPFIMQLEKLLPWTRCPHAPEGPGQSAVAMQHGFLPQPQRNAGLFYTTFTKSQGWHKGPAGRNRDSLLKILLTIPAPAVKQMFSVVPAAIVSDKSTGVILDKRLKLFSATRAGSGSLDRSSATHLAGRVEAKTSC